MMPGDYYGPALHPSYWPNLVLPVGSKVIMNLEVNYPEDAAIGMACDYYYSPADEDFS